MSLRVDHRLNDEMIHWKFLQRSRLGLAELSRLRASNSYKYESKYFKIDLKRHDQAASLRAKMAMMGKYTYVIWVLTKKGIGLYGITLLGFPSLREGKGLIYGNNSSISFRIRMLSLFMAYPRIKICNVILLHHLSLGDNSSDPSHHNFKSILLNETMWILTKYYGILTIS